MRERQDAQASHAARLEKVSLDRRNIEAHLQALQAQIERHFLFNTLANIKLLYETESARAKRLIRDLATYLDTALPQMRESRSTLARELELAQAYLNVLKVRMGERLKVEIDVPADLRDATLPPMMLLTLVSTCSTPRSFGRFIDPPSSMSTRSRKSQGTREGIRGCI